jgi:hypothetical protein
MCTRSYTQSASREKEEVRRRKKEQYHVKSEIALRLHHYETLKRVSSEIKKWLSETTVGHFPSTPLL